MYKLIVFLCLTSIAAAEPIEYVKVPANTVTCEQSMTLTYGTVKAIAEQTERPWLIVATSPTCSPCAQLKRDVLPLLKVHAESKELLITVLDVSGNAHYQKNFCPDGRVPSIILYQRRSTQWSRRYAVGFMPLKSLVEFVKGGRR